MYIYIYIYIYISYENKFKITKLLFSLFSVTRCATHYTNPLSNSNISKTVKYCLQKNFY